MVVCLRTREIWIIWGSSPSSVFTSSCRCNLTLFHPARPFAFHGLILRKLYFPGDIVSRSFLPHDRKARIASYISETLLLFPKEVALFQG